MEEGVGDSDPSHVRPRSDVTLGSRYIMITDRELNFITRRSSRNPRFKFKLVYQVTSLDVQRLRVLLPLHL